ncbi:MAG TPA: type II toxin-antitoxin system RelE/ParE family toxin [Hansschlegelia sp.]
MPWAVLFHDDFRAEYQALDEDVQDVLLAALERLRAVGPALGRPRVDTLSGSRHANMKELRFGAKDQEWRVAFAFDPSRNAVVLVGGAKSGISQRQFYRRLLTIADERFDDHLASIARRP